MIRKTRSTFSGIRTPYCTAPFGAEFSAAFAGRGFHLRLLNIQPLHGCQYFFLTLVENH
jgi:hypothetical protein